MRHSSLLAAFHALALAACGWGGIPQVDETGPGGGTGGAGGAKGQPLTCAKLGATCGPAGDGFGGILDCGVCAAPATCGGGGIPSKCGGPSVPCVPRTCADRGYACGPQGDGCGGPLACGFCDPGETCGALVPNHCGAVAACSNLCLQQVACAPGVTTILSGTVYAPTDPSRFGAPDPLYNATVYVPNAPIADFSPGVSCDQCGAEVSGSPLTLTHSGSDGKFKLANVPVGKNIPVVFQLGRWRRQVFLDVAPCVDNHVAAEQSRLPRNQQEGDIPKIAMVTGRADPLECVLRKIGIDDAEFTRPSSKGGTGRVQLYVANGANDPTWSAPPASELWKNGGELPGFDMVLLACEGTQVDKEAAAEQNVVDYANQGGRIFATHYSYTWLYDRAPFSKTGKWTPSTKAPTGQSSFTGIVDTSFAKGVALTQWLDTVSASTSKGSGKVTIEVARQDLADVNPPGQRWIYTKAPDPPTVQHYTFNTPLDAPESLQCGRVLFSDFHVTSKTGTGSTTPQKAFPDECEQVPMSPQERVLEFMLFDLSSCVEAGHGTVCVPKSCEDLGFDCGPAGDGCGAELFCGKCPEGQACGDGGKLSVCAPKAGAPCQKVTCEKLDTHCGPAADGCGGLQLCGDCPAGQTCGGANVPGACG